VTTTPAKKATARRSTKGRTVEDVPLPDRDPAEEPINEPQMRQLHVLLRSRLNLTDRADILDYLTVFCDRPIGSRTELHRHEADRLLIHLGHLPPWPPTPEDWAALRADFPSEAIGKLPRSTCRDCSQSPRKVCERHTWVSGCRECRNSHSSATMHIDYVGHADVTQRLNTVDPSWSWEPMGVDQFGNPAYDRDGNLWIKMTVLGVTRIGVGDAGNGKGAKERIGDALRNAAMRFGVALDLWAKGDRDWAHTDKSVPEPHADDAPPREETSYEDGGVPPKGMSLLRLDDLASRVNLNREQITAKWRESHGHIPVGELVNVPAADLHALAESIEAYVATLAS
jgi:hypothetical protein